MGTATDLRSAVQSTVQNTVDERLPNRDELRDLTEDLRGRAGEVRERAGDASVTVRQQVSELEPLARRAAISGLEAFQAILRVMVVMPRLLLKLMGVLRTAAVHADDVRDRGFELSERARDAVRSVPPSRRGRWRSRARSAGLLGAGFSVGLILGWVLAQRREPEAGNDVPVVLSPVDDSGDTAGATNAGNTSAGLGTRGDPSTGDRSARSDGPEAGTGT